MPQDRSVPDPFRAHALAERLKILGVAVVFIAIIVAAGLLAVRPWEQGGRIVEGEVLQFGIVAQKYGNRTLVTVLLPDGSRRRLTGPRLLPGPCRAGDKIELVETGKVVGLGRRGCYGR